MIIHEIESLISEADDVASAIKLGALEGKFPEETKFTKDLNAALSGKGYGDKFDALVADGKKSLDDLGSDLSDFFSKVKAGIGTVIDNVKAEAERTPGNLEQIGRNIKDEMYRTPGNIKQIGQNIKDEFNRTPGNIKDMYNDAAEYSQKVLTKIQQTPDDISTVVAKYFEGYSNNPVMRSLSNLSIENPTVFNALVIAVPLVLVGALSAGSYAIVKKIKTAKDAQTELDKAGTELENAKTDSAKAAASKKVALIGAKAILIAKASK